MGSQWDDRSGRWDDREGRQRSTEYYGQGQSGYAAGRYEGDRSYQSRNQRWSGDERYRDRDFDERFDGRSSEPWSPQDRHWAEYVQDRNRRPHRYESSVGHYSHPGQRGYGQGFGEGGTDMMYGGFLGQGGQQMGYEPSRAHSYGQGFASQPGGGPVRSHRGKGPTGYTRSDERIREHVCEVLTDHHEIDATNIEVEVRGGEVMLSGNVDDRWQKRLAEDIVADISGVKDVSNQLRVGASRASTSQSTGNGNDKRHRA
jgi:osmotically-inducible protein OsmY